MSVRGIDDEHVDTGLDQGAGLGAHVAADADGRADAQPPAGVGGRGVEPGANRSGAGQHARQRAVRVGHHRDLDRGVLEQVEDLARLGAHRGGDEVGDRRRRALG